MVIVGLTFVVILGIVLGAYFLFVVRPEQDERTKMLRRVKVAPAGAVSIGATGAAEESSQRRRSR